MHKNIYMNYISFFFLMIIIFLSRILYYSTFEVNPQNIDNVYKCILTRVSDKQNLNSPKKACKYRN